MQLKHLYEFGPFRINEAERVLLREDEVVPLPPKAFELLLVLVQRTGHVLSKDELMSRVWPDSIVEEANLSHNIYRLREALGAKESGERYIETIPRRGYRFVDPVRMRDDPPVELIVAEHTRAHIVIEEEETVTANGDSAPRPTTVTERRSVTDRKKRFWSARKTVPLAVGLTIVLGGALWWQRERFYVTRAGTATPPQAPRLVPLTTFPDEELGPALSPDGKMVAYAWKGGTPDRMNIYVQQIGGGNPIRLTSYAGRDGAPAWSSDGQSIVFARGSTEPGMAGIYLVPAFGGRERQLLAATCNGLDWSADGRYVVFTAVDPEAKVASLGVLTVDDLSVRKLTAPSGVVNGDVKPAISPDGHSVAFVRSAEETAELYVVPFAGGEPRQLTFEKRRIDSVTWTLDGRELIFASNRGGIYELWRMPAEGGEAVRVTGAGPDAHEPSVTRAGNRLAYAQQSIDTNIWRVPIGGREAGDSRVKLIASSRRDENPRLSPDGNKLAFESNRSGAREIWISNSDGGDPAQLTSYRGPITSNPRWSPDSRRLAFDSRPDGYAAIFVVGAEGGSPHQVTPAGQDCLAPSWSHDGQWLYFGSNRDGSWQIWKVSVAGGPLTQVTQSGGYEAVESPDGKFVYYNKFGFYTVGVFRLPVDGGPETMVLDLPQLGSFSDWAVTDEGIYYIHRYDAPGKLTTSFSVDFLNFATRQTTVVAKLDHDPTSNPGLSISPDGRSLIYSIDDYRIFDLMLIENFR
jgi:Tol biopolymer transport system component/DNA-binding winged helix-turn-helix (wHTH) protein